MIRTVATLLIITLALFSITAECQQEYSFQPVNIWPGQSQGPVHDILQDDNGFLWFATTFGLYRYDGYEFLQFKHIPDVPDSLSGDYILDIEVDPAGTLWVVNRQGLVDSLNTRSNTIVRHSKPGEGSSFSLNSVRLLGEEMLFLASDGSIFQLDEETDMFYPCVDQDGFITRSFNSNIQNFVVQSRNNMSIFRSTLNLPGLQDVSSTIDHWFYQDEAGTLFGQYLGGELAVFDGIPQRVDSESFGLINSIGASTNGGVLIAADTGLYEYSSDNQLRKIFPAQTDVSAGADIKIHKTYNDRTDSLWVATSRGAYKFSATLNKFRSIPVEQTLLDIKADHAGDIWCSTTTGGINRFSNGVGPNLLPEPYSASIVETILPDGDSLILGADRGLLRYTPATGEVEELSGPQQFADLLRDSSGRLWVATYVNSYALLNETGQLTFFNIEKSRPASDGLDATVLHEDSQGALWIGFDGDGIIRVNESRSGYTKFDYQRHFNSLSNNSVICIASGEDNTLWIGTRYGLNRLDVASQTFTNYFEADGLPDNTVCGLYVNGNDVWITTQKGICRLDSETDEIISYHESNGLQEFIFTPGAITLAGTRLYFGGLSAVCSIDLEGFQENAYPPRLRIVNAIAGAEEKTVINLPESVSLPHWDNRLTVNFSAMDFTNPEQNRYQYILHNHDTKWSDISRERAVTYTILPPGDYTFEVRAQNNDGVWSQQSATLAIEIIPSFWMRMEVRIASAMLIVSVVLASFYLRMRYMERHRKDLKREIAEKEITQIQLIDRNERLRALASELTLSEERERRRISQILHDKIGQSLTIGKARLDTLRHKVNDEEKGREMENIGTVFSQAIALTRDLTVELSPPSLYRFGLPATLESLLNKFEEQHGLQTMLLQETTVKLNEDIAVLLYQSVREMLFNIVKHARARSVMIRLTDSGNHYCVTIEDDGVGFDFASYVEKSKHTNKYGLFSIINRIESINGSFEVDSEIGAGTVITLTVPLLSHKEEDDDD